MNTYTEFGKINHHWYLTWVANSILISSIVVSSLVVIVILKIITFDVKSLKLIFYISMFKYIKENCCVFDGDEIIIQMQMIDIFNRLDHFFLNDKWLNSNIWNKMVYHSIVSNSMRRVFICWFWCWSPFFTTTANTNNK